MSIQFKGQQSSQQILLDIQLQKDKNGLQTHTIHKINSKYIIDLNVRPKPIYILEENVEMNCDLECGNGFLDILLKVQIITKLDFIKFKTSSLRKAVVNE